MTGISKTAFEVAIAECSVDDWCVQIKSLESEQLHIEGALSSEDITLLSSYIDKNKLLKEITLQSNALEVDLFTSIIQAIEQHNALKQLCIIDNTLSESHVEILSQFLKVTTHLHELSLNACLLSESSIQSLCTSLLVNRSVRLLDLTRQELSHESGASLQRLVLENQSIYSLKIDTHCLSEDIYDELDDLLNRNYEAMSDSLVTSWSIQTSIVLRKVGTISCLLASENGKIWVGTSEGFLYIWNPGDEDTQIVKKIQTFDEETRDSKRRINGMLEYKDVIWCITDDRYITILSTRSEKIVKRIPLHTHQAISICRYENMAYLGGTTGEISRWDLDTYTCLHTIVLNDRHPISSMHVDGSFLWVSTIVLPKRHCYILVFSKNLGLIAPWVAHTDVLHNITDYGDAIITSSMDGKLRVWDVSKFHYPEKSTNESAPLTATLKTELHGQLPNITKHIRCGNILICCGDDNILVLWNPYLHSQAPCKIHGSDYGMATLCKIDDKNFLSADKAGRIIFWSKVKKT